MLPHRRTIAGTSRANRPPAEFSMAQEVIVSVCEIIIGSHAILASQGSPQFQVRTCQPRSPAVGFAGSRTTTLRTN
jgi:hypothetical protein